MALTGKQVTEIIGIAALVVSLLFVALELRENRLTARAASYQEIGIALGELWAGLAHDSELTDIVIKTNSEDLNIFNSLTVSERRRAAYLLIGSLRIYEVLYLQVQEGLLEEDALRYLGYGDITFSSPLFRNLWSDVKSNITPEFSTYIELQTGL
ncbi:MAG: hypothetical protein O2971_19805 [Proteobacteria bacterium]|nr:hypothetical protein [Pseudomonadota bacterium]